jgi:hypothetical protein
LLFTKSAAKLVKAAWIPLAAATNTTPGRDVAIKVLPEDSHILAVLLVRAKARRILRAPTVLYNKNLPWYVTDIFMHCH